MIKYIIGLVALILGVTLFYNKVYLPKTTFKTVKVKEGVLEESVRGIGNVGAKNIYNITAQSGGKILEILSDEGEWVKKGDLLIVMDGVDLAEQLEVAQANLTKAKYDLAGYESELTNLKAQEVLLQTTYKRYRKLKEQNFVSQAEYDKANTDLQSIKASISASVSHSNGAKANIVVAQKSIKVVQAKIDRLKVYAPSDGYVIAKEVEVSQDVIPSATLLQIVDAKTLWVKTKIDERVSAQIKLGQSATISLRSQPNKVYKGVVKRVVSVSDAVTLEREIDVAFTTLPQPFFINEQAEVNIAVKSYTDVVTIPSKVVVQEGGVLGVWVVKSSHVEFQKIDIIGQNDDAIAVSNIAKNTQIVIPNKNKKTLTNGMKIHL